MSTTNYVVHINHNEVDILCDLSTWLINFWNYDASKVAEGEEKVEIPVKQFNQLKEKLSKVIQVVNGIDSQMTIWDLENKVVGEPCKD